MVETICSPNSTDEAREALGERRPRVLQLVQGFHQGGSERQAVQLTRLLHESGRYRLHVACLNGTGGLRDEVERLGLMPIPVFPLNSFFDANAIVQLGRFARLLREWKIDLVHTHDFYSNIFGMAAAALAGVPVRVASRRESAVRPAVKRWVERRAYRLAHAVVANCWEVRRQLIGEGVRADRIVVVPNGIDVARMTPAGLRVEEALATLSLQGAAGRRLVTIVANLAPVKDHATFLRAAQQIHARVPEAAFVLAGEGQLAEPLSRLAADLGIAGDVFFVGLCRRVPDLLALSEVCVLSSRSEGLSSAILEYMLASRPVVVTDVGGAREAVTEGETGYIVPPGNAEAMAARVLDLLHDPGRGRALGERGRRTVLGGFSCDAQLARTEALYGRLLARYAFGAHGAPSVRSGWARRSVDPRPTLRSDGEQRARVGGRPIDQRASSRSNATDA
jgi:glycosyltransferase involved in cell wall biosynthesis